MSRLMVTLAVDNAVPGPPISNRLGLPLHRRHGVLQRLAFRYFDRQRLVAAVNDVDVKVSREIRAMPWPEPYQGERQIRADRPGFPGGLPLF